MIHVPMAHCSWSTSTIGTLIAKTLWWSHLSAGRSLWAPYTTYYLSVLLFANFTSLIHWLQVANYRISCNTNHQREWPHDDMEQVADIPIMDSTAVTLHGRLLVIGGSDSKPSTAIHMYQPTNKSWQVISHMKTPGSSCPPQQPTDDSGRSKYCEL